MKRTIIAALIAVFVFVTPVAVFAQEPDPAKEPITSPVIVDTTPAAPVSNFQDFGTWLLAVFVLLASTGGTVSLYIIDKGIKPAVNKILVLVPGDSLPENATRAIILNGGIFVAAYYVVTERSVNLFVGAPSQVLAIFPSHNVQLAASIILLGVSVMATYSLKKLYGSSETAAS